MINRIKIPDVVTILNAFCGLTAIFLSFFEYTPLIPVLILFAAILDGIDGYLARKFTSSELGESLDSMADVISFGVAPIVILFLLYGHSLLLIISLYISIGCGILRLARFESDAKKINGFEGLPITASGVIIASFILADANHVVHANIVGLFIILISILMISSIPFPKFRTPKEIVPMFIIFGVTIVGNIMSVHASFFSFVFFLLMCLYLLHPLIDLVKNKK